jgi:putative DNA primase/helicase
MVISVIEEIHLKSKINEILPNAKVIKLKGYSDNSTSYKNAKKPPYGYRWKSEPTLRESEIDSWINENGWIRVVIPENRIIIDIDNNDQGEIVKKLLEAENVNHHSIKTPNGWQFIFGTKDKMTRGIKQITKYFTQLGVIIDTRTAGSGYIVFPTKNTEGRYLHSISKKQLDVPPNYLLPIRNSQLVNDKATKEKYIFPIPIQESGSRNNTLYNFGTHLRAWGISNGELSKALELIYEFFVLDKTDFTFKELKTLTQSLINWRMEPPIYRENPVYDDDLPEICIPEPYQIKDNALIKVDRKTIGGEEIEKIIMVSRLTPRIMKEYSNLERNSVHYEIAWIDRGIMKREVVSASTISTKKELLTLADRGFPCNDLNFKYLIDYFDKYLALNQLDLTYMVERLGNIKNHFIHPLSSQGVEIIPYDSGEKQLLEGFESRGTSESWKRQVFDRVKNLPEVLFFVLASFTSVILHDLKVNSFIVDLSGATSKGKTTALHVARSVWGSENLINEWNTTKVAIERKAAFLNSFPLYMDDTRKADDHIIQSIVYQFSGGRSKGRGSLNGTQKETTWNNILLSTGEVTMSDYANKAAGVAARVIPLVNEPFAGLGYEYFSELYQAMENNYGAVGLKFIEEWQIWKKKLIPEFHMFKEHYMKKSKGNEVLIRLSMFYAAVHFSGSVANKLMDLEVDLHLLDQVFNQMAKENKALDKPRELFEQILTALDSRRQDIYYNFQPKEIKAIFKNKTLFLTPAYLSNFLGVENNTIRREWLKRGFTVGMRINERFVDYKSINHKGSTFRVVQLNMDVIKEIGFNFDSN